MTKNRLAAFAASILLMPFGAHAQEPQGLTIRTRIDSTYVFGFDLRESRSAKGGIWNLKTGKPETPQSYTQAKPDTLAGRPVVMLYREVVIGNHPLNGWEAWTRKDNSWVRLEEQMKEIPNCIAREVAESGMTAEEFMTLIPILDKFIGVLK